VTRLAKKRIYLPENPDIRFDLDDETGDAVMYVCGSEQTRKKLPFFSERSIRKYFKQEIEEFKNFACPTPLGEEKGEANA